MKVEFFKDRKKEWRWRLRASNGRIVATSGEGYRRPSGAAKTLQRLATAVRLHSAIRYLDVLEALEDAKEKKNAK